MKWYQINGTQIFSSYDDFIEALVTVGNTAPPTDTTPLNVSLFLENGKSVSFSLGDNFYVKFVIGGAASAPTTKAIPANILGYSNKDFSISFQSFENAALACAEFVAPVAKSIDSAQVGVIYVYIAEAVRFNAIHVAANSASEFSNGFDEWSFNSIRDLVKRCDNIRKANPNISRYALPVEVCTEFLEGISDNVIQVLGFLETVKGINDQNNPAPVPNPGGGGVIDGVDGNHGDDPIDPHQGNDGHPE